MTLQMADCQAYVKTLHQLHIHSPAVILVPDTFLTAAEASMLPSGKRSGSTSLLLEFIEEEFPNVPLEPIGRRYWNEHNGAYHLLCFLRVVVDPYTQDWSSSSNYVLKMTSVPVLCFLLPTSQSSYLPSTTC